MLRRLGDEPGDIAGPVGEKAPKAWLDFAKEMRIVLPEGKFLTFGQTLYYAPLEMPDIRGVKVMRPGLELGIVKKDRFEPAHGLALWLHTAARTHVLQAGSREMDGYLHGETIPSTLRGWCLVMADSYSVGWGKGDGNQLKNHYPKGLRR